MVTMSELPPDFPDGLPDVRDRSQQAARFLDLTRRHSTLFDEHGDLFAGLAAADLDGDGVPDLIAANEEIRTDLVDDSIRDNDADDISIDSAAFGVIPPGTRGVFTLDDDGDVFGDGNGFGSGTGFAADDPFD
jgi:FG-GAP repeat